MLPIFDGYQRFDLALSFKRMDEAKVEHGYQGPVVVCSVAYRPIAGHRPARFAIRYLMEQRDRVRRDCHGDAERRRAGALGADRSAHAAAFRAAGSRSRIPATTRSATPIMAWPLTMSG